MRFEAFLYHTATTLHPKQTYSGSASLTLFFANLYHLISSGNGKGLIWINVSTLELQELDNGSYLCRYAQCSRDPRHTLCHIPHHHRSGVYRSGRQKGNARGTFLGTPISELEYAQLSIIHVHQLPCCL